MPHHRFRFIEPALKKALKASPIVGLFGHRQTGKTTLLSALCSDYKTMDMGSVLETAQLDPIGFLSKHVPPFGIDESQFCPEIFPALKEMVRRKPAPGQFFLSGSVHFSSRRQIRESLTGRILLFELFPFSLAEAQELPLRDPTKIGTKETTPRVSLKQWAHYIQSGGLPGICFKRDASLRAAAYESHIDTLLNRDLRLIFDTRLNATTLRQFIRALAMQVGAPYEISELARQSRVARDTVKKLLTACEALYLIRTLPTEGMRSRGVLLWEDVGLLHHLTEGQLPPLTYALNAFFQNVRCGLKYPFGSMGSFFCYRTRGGASVALVFRRQAEITGWILLDTFEPDRSSIASANSFLKSYPNASVKIIGPNLKNGSLNSKVSIQNILDIM